MGFFVFFLLWAVLRDKRWSCEALSGFWLPFWIWFEVGMTHISTDHSPRHLKHHHQWVNPIETIVAFMRRAIAFLSGPWAHVCDENKGFISDSRNFFVLSPLVLRVLSFERGNSALSDDVWYCSGWYWKFLRNIDLKSRHAKCVRSAWPVCSIAWLAAAALQRVRLWSWLAAAALQRVRLWSYNLSRVFSFPR